MSKIILILFIIISRIILCQTKLDDFEKLGEWSVFKSDGVETSLSSVQGRSGYAVKFSYDFTKGSGYGGFQKSFPIKLPDNYQFTFFIKAESPNNNLEIKFLDESGENVWWVNNRNFNFPKDWKKITIKKRHIQFAWGPTENKDLKEISSIEFTVASFTGGKGSIQIDDLFFEELPPLSSELKEPEFIGSSERSEYKVSNLFDNNLDTKWLSLDGDKGFINIDFMHYREIGGFLIDWDEDNYPRSYEILFSNDNNKWESIYRADYSKGERSYIRLTDAESRYVKIILNNSSGTLFGIKEIKILDPLYSENLNRFFINIAKDFPRSHFPRYFHEEASYWNIVGVNSDVKEALINEDGMIEVDKLSFSIEPMLWIGDELIAWDTVEKEQGLEKNYLPIPYVKWIYKNLSLQIETFAAGDANKNSELCINYRILNTGNEIKNGKLFLIVRPFQVNPYYQELNITGGVSHIKEIELDNSRIVVDNKTIYSLTPFDTAGAMLFEEGNVVSLLSKGKFPVEKKISDPHNLGSAVLSYEYSLKPNEGKEIYVVVPFYGVQVTKEVGQFKKSKMNIVDFWDSKISRVKFNLPSSADKIINTYRSNLAYILINRDKAGIQPGSRSYERSWIRDGALTSSALLKSGITDEVREFINWYSEYQYENGKIPCVVDTRGPDPVPENDSHGEYIFLVKQFFNFTKDTTILKSQNERIKKTVDYIEYLVNQRSTDHYRNGNDSVRAYYGIMPESISHEGYSAKPMHSYWDNFFTIRGLKDAAEIQHILNDKSYNIISKIRDEFNKNLYSSLQLAIKTRNIDYIPGCVELGDFDPTSTTIALYPVNEYPNLPQPYLNNTFDQYYNFFTNRRDGNKDWINYTPYEVRTIGSFIFLDQPDKAREAIEFFLKDQRPQGWNHWAEVVWNGERKPGYIGDMPHTWVGSDFINAFHALFVYENDYDSSVIIGAGLYQEWIDNPGGVSIENLPTYYGNLSYSVRKIDSDYLFNIYGDLEMPKGNIIIRNFNSLKTPSSVLINGKEIESFTNKNIIVTEFPAEVWIKYEQN